MAQPQPEITLEAVGLERTAAVAIAPSKNASVIYTDPPDYFKEALEDAERLLKYAAEVGVDIEDDVRDYVLEARAAVTAGWDEAIAANLLAALGKLAARLRPITAESLKAYGSAESRSTVRNYWIVAICLAAIILPFSVASFVATAISSGIRADIAAANDLAVKLRTQLGPPPGNPSGISDPDGTVIGELQQYATAIRAIDGRARQLRVLVFNAEMDPFSQIRRNSSAIHDKFQLPQGLPNLAVAAYDRTTVYQDVRYFAQSLLDDVSFFYGATAACLLPVLYALLGTCAYLLRTFESQMASRTFVPSVADSARFLVAAIGGGVVGLFSNFTMGQGASIPPLAIAFLVGYAVDVFFAFLESMLQTFGKNRPPSQESKA